jgi:hypothetical protein
MATVELSGFGGHWSFYGAAFDIYDSASIPSVFTVKVVGNFEWKIKGLSIGAPVLATVICV